MAKIKKGGLILTLLSMVLAIAAFVFYLINCNTAYYAKMGMNPKIVVLLCAAVLLELLLIAGNLKGRKRWMDILPLAACVLLVAAAFLFAGARVESAATIMTFEKNASNVADLRSALIGVGCCLAAAVTGIVASFFDIAD